MSYHIALYQNNTDIYRDVTFIDVSVILSASMCRDGSGNLAGLSAELVQAVCDEAGVDCEHVVAPALQCWNPDTLEGPGI